MLMVPPLSPLDCAMTMNECDLRAKVLIFQYVLEPLIRNKNETVILRRNTQLINLYKCMYNLYSNALKPLQQQQRQQQRKRNEKKKKIDKSTTAPNQLHINLV